MAVACLCSGTASAEEAGLEYYRGGFYEEAISRWRQDATAGDARSAYHLGVAYMDGAVVERDYVEARKWYLVAAKVGDRDAQFDLGTLFENGYGVPRSLAAAAAWYRAAAEKGHGAAQYNLATLYEEGKAVPRDDVQAYGWYYLAAQQGFTRPRFPGLDGLTNRMSTADIEKGQTLALQYSNRE